MKVFLDDIREAPKGWKQTDNAADTIVLLLLNDVSELSLDHDIGDENKNGNGYEVLKWIEKQVFINNYVPPKIHIHTSNPAARIRMENAVKAIKAMCDE